MIKQPKKEKNHKLGCNLNIFRNKHQNHENCNFGNI